MRTRRIAIGCRRSGSASTVAIAPSGSSDPAVETLAWPPPQLEPWMPPPRLESWIRYLDPLPSRMPGPARAGGPPVPAPAPPPPGEHDLTLADLTSHRRDLAWNDNPGWPAGLDWTTIARAARSHSPRHARRRVSHTALTWTGAGFIAAVLVTILVATVTELIG